MAAVVATATAVAVVPAGAAFAADAPPAPPVVAPTDPSAGAPAGPAAGNGPVIVGPLLRIFHFGTDIGLSIGCGLAISLLDAGASQFGASAAISPLDDALTSGCTTIGVQGTALVEQFQSADAPLAIFNNFLNTPIDQFGAALRNFGTIFGPALAPFGPTIAGLGGTIQFFEGS